MIEFSCPNCGRPMRVQDAAAGKTGRCKNCGASLVAPTPKRIFEEPRYWVAAVGGIVAIQGFIFTVIDAGIFSVLMTFLGLVVAVGGLHVEARPVLMRVSQIFRARFVSFKEELEQFKEKREQNRARLDEELALQKRRDARDAKVRDLHAQQAEERERQSDGLASANTAESPPTFISATPMPTNTPEPQAEEEFNPFANLVDAHAATNRPEAISTFVSATLSPPSVPILQPERVQCPYCGEPIARTAVKCRYCNEFLDGRTVPPPPSIVIYGAGNDSRASATSKSEYEVWSSHPKMFQDSPVAFTLSCLLIPVFGLGLLILIPWWLSCINSTLIVTNRRTTLRKGILSKHTREVRHDDVRYLEVRQSFFNRLFGIGSIAISSAGQSGLELEISGINDPQSIKKMIDGYR